MKPPSVRSDGYYRRFPGDYQRDTRGLSLAEHGAYNQLLDAYYSEEELSSDPMTLYRIAGAMDETERKAVDKVVRKYFTVQGDHLIQERVEREIAARREFKAGEAAYLEEQARKAKLGAAARWGEKPHAETTTDPPADARTMPEAMPAGMPAEMPEGVPERCPNDALASASASRSGSASPTAPRRSRASAADGAKRPLRPPPAESWETYCARVRTFFFELGAGDLDPWREAYPAVDIETQLAQAREWLLSHESNRKKNLLSFTTRWLSRAQEKARGSPRDPPRRLEPKGFEALRELRISEGRDPETGQPTQEGS